MTATVVSLFEGDQRCERLCDALLELIYERGKGLPFPSVLGVLRIVEQQLITDHLEDA